MLIWIGHVSYFMWRCFFIIHNTRVPHKVKVLLTIYLKKLNKQLPDLLNGFYLYGSISLGAFVEGSSDVDFMAVIQRDLSEADIAILKQIHKEIQSSYPQMSLDGIYITKEDITGLDTEAKTCIYFNDGEIQGTKELQKNSIDVFQFYNYGVCILGKEPSQYNFSIEWNLLMSRMQDNLNSYWVNWKKRGERFLSVQYFDLLFSVKSIEWGVLGVSRLYYSFNEQGITSKVGAGEYAINNVPERWHKIINEAMRLRLGNPKSYYKSIFARRNDALAYMEYIINESNKLKFVE